MIKNDYRTNWLWYLLLRFLLDGLAGLRFLVLGEFSNIMAIIKAHFNVYRSFFSLIKKRKKLKSKKVSELSQDNFFVPVSIVYRYFVLKKLYWQEINK